MDPIPGVVPCTAYHHQVLRDTNPAVWLEDFCLAYRAGGADNDIFIVQYLPLYLAESARASLEHLPADNIHSWADLKRIYIGNF